ncbi:uncharacterized protein MONOS_14786 [Monocercomonoides exilis]|uniref:uncharacterized protein n=1 Tax=Monocercomonoides exilis TaxID=2049356 RepID=UPI00355A5D53|nr:hypothetical protein MONOS_14786 [Monocercomonoides exilis]|eukprot:MONOS_14786.1-p1 / transcript=MONOS_14786.1 / gene=MONOS_14786 / organism=Monocercomonoides_exilis_PA203 / gene_product=unspecified product / transcript_product=unspecified product / location=Mono_scaffold01073:11856-12287(+) / protein_length=144 / sequence_SO=supercontig / SO=protein_coding / is_pseudo=false
MKRMLIKKKENTKQQKNTTALLLKQYHKANKTICCPNAMKQQKKHKTSFLVQKYIKKTTIPSPLLRSHPTSIKHFRTASLFSPLFTPSSPCYQPASPSSRCGARKMTQAVKSHIQLLRWTSPSQTSLTSTGKGSSRRARRIAR